MNEERVLASDRRLSQVERVIDTFVAPTATFRDVLRNTSWWLPFVLMVAFSTASTYTIDRHVGFSQVAENAVHASPKQEEQMSQVTPQERASQMEKRAIGTRYFSYGFPLFLLLILAIYSAILLATVNFGLGARMTFGQVFAVNIYAALPYVAVSLLTILTISFSNNAESFNLQNPVGTNLAYYLPDAAPWLKALLTQLDVVRLWSLLLTILGIKIISGRSTGQAAAVVVGYWVLIVLISVAATAAFS